MELMFLSVSLHTFHVHSTLLWITRRLIVSVILMCIVGISVFSTSGIAVLIFFCILSMCILFYFGLLVGKLSLLC